MFSFAVDVSLTLHILYIYMPKIHLLLSLSARRSPNSNRLRIYIIAQRRHIRSPMYSTYGLPRSNQPPTKQSRSTTSCLQKTLMEAEHLPWKLAQLRTCSTYTCTGMPVDTGISFSGGLVSTAAVLVVARRVALRPGIDIFSTVDAQVAESM